MDGYKDETVLKQGSKSKQSAPKGSKGKDKKLSKKKSSRPDTRENVREHVDRSLSPHPFNTLLNHIFDFSLVLEYPIASQCTFNWSEKLESLRCH